MSFSGDTMRPKLPAEKSCAFFIALGEFMETVKGERSDDIVQAKLEAWIRGYEAGARAARQDR